MTAAPTISVVIPTWQRPQLALAAVRSALSQTVADLEVIVVVDGRDAESIDTLGTLRDDRLRLHVPERHLGNADARNRGVALATAALVAFLDDDDLWLPHKLERQLRRLPGGRGTRPVVACRFAARGGPGTMTWPRRLPEAGEDLSEYFFCRRTPFTGEGMVITSTILTTRAFAVEVPFTSALKRHVDTDWLLRAARVPGFRLEFADGDEPLTIWNVDHARSRITTRRDWRESLEWCRRNRSLFTDRSYAAFLLHVVGSNAAAENSWRALPMLLGEALRDGKPAAVDIASHLANFSLPASVQRRAALWYANWSAGPASRRAG